MRSAWLKLARSIEHQRYLARLSREFEADGPAYRYEYEDNGQDASDPLVRASWRLRVVRPFPERWGVVLGDVVSTLRASLDHALWTAVTEHSGPPARPHAVAFPITSTERDFARQAKELAPLVTTKTWEVVATLQPLHGGDRSHLAPLEILRWLSNVDKHRHLHVVGSTQVDIGGSIVSGDGDLDVVEQEIAEGESVDGGVVGRIVLRRPATGRAVDLRPTFAYTPSIRICDSPVIEYRPLSSVVPVMTDAAMMAIHAVAEASGLPGPDLDRLILGEEHDAVADEYGGVVARQHGRSTG